MNVFFWAHTSGNEEKKRGGGNREERGQTAEQWKGNEGEKEEKGFQAREKLK